MHLLCLDANTGVINWDVEVFRRAADEIVGIHPKNGHASPTPVIEGDRLYVHFGPVATAALDLSGNVIWTNQDLRFDARHGGGGSPIVSGDLLIFHCDGVVDPFVAALGKATGQIRWRSARPHMEMPRFSFSTPLEIEVAGKKQIISSGSRYVFAYDPQTGDAIWHVGYPNKWSIVPRPVYAHGLVYVCTGFEGPAELLAIRPDGGGDVTETHVVWRTNKNVPHTPSPLIVDDLLFFVSDAGVASCLDARTGQSHWQKRLGGNFSASPLYAGGHVYFPNEDGKCIVVRAASKLEIVARNDLAEPTLASYAVSDSALFIRTESHLYRIQQLAER